MRAHLYRARTEEEGIMLIGSQEEIRSLGERLVQGASNPFQPNAEGWPPEVAELAIQGTRFKVSFHLECASGKPPTNVAPRSRAALWLVLLVPFAAIGVTTVYGWLVHAR